MFVSDQSLSMPRVSGFLDGDSLEIIREMHPKDPMYGYPGAPDLYFVAGPQALRCIHLAMLATSLQRVESVLDFACGAGRVLRVLKAAFPNAALTACDVWEEGVEFCSKVFGATGVVANEDPEKTELGGPFDLIWCGSLLTHVDRDAWSRFLKLFRSVLTPGGVLVFTTRGRYIAEEFFRTGRNRYSQSEEQIAEILRDYDESGFGWSSFGWSSNPGLGDSVSSPAWVCEQLDQQTPDLQLLLYVERGWMDAQDVVACVKR
jgi:SAM-dependent methyltransferase